MNRNIVVGIATRSRPVQLLNVLKLLAEQTRPPDRIVVAPTCEQDLPQRSTLDRLRVEIVYGRLGLCAQRNTILSVCDDKDIVVFLDDDFYPSKTYVSTTEAVVNRYEDVALFGCSPFHDGATSAGIDHTAAMSFISIYDTIPVNRSLPIMDVPSAYGCNMVLRNNVARENCLAFDENLPLYGWLEDRDFSVRIKKYGRVARVYDLRGVHLGAKVGRVSGKRYGYSQIANAVYLANKGSLRYTEAIMAVGGFPIRNLLGALFPEPWIDRRGRLVGNLLALKDMVTLRLKPDRILSIS